MNAQKFAINAKYSILPILKYSEYKTPDDYRKSEI